MPRTITSMVFCVALVFVFSASGADYYVDSAGGNDAHAGRSPTDAWKSLARVNSTVFQPGDTLRFKAGTRYQGQLKPQGSGLVPNKVIRAIQIGMYGSGAKPRIDGAGETTDALLLENTSGWEIADLEITNQGTNREPWRTGVHILTDRFGLMKHIHLSRLYVHDVNGDLRKSSEGCGIYFESRGGNASYFDDVVIEDCHLVRTDRNGICQRSRGWPRSTNIIIRGNVLEDIGGDGIKLWGSDGGIIEHNVLRGGGMRCTDAAAGIWPFSSGDSVIQFNEVSGMKGAIDGQAFDSDYGCRNSIFQYNFSHDNEGGFMLLCAPGRAACEGTIVRYNISQNDGANSQSVIHFGGHTSNSRIYNNTFYIGPKQDLLLLNFTDWSGGNASNTIFQNNIFYVDGRVTYHWGKSLTNVFENNVFYGNHVDPPEDPHAITNRPPLTNPGVGETIKSLAGYQPGSSGDFPRGLTIPENGLRDFFGQPLGTNEPPSVGAAEVPAR